MKWLAIVLVCMVGVRVESVEPLQFHPPKPPTVTPTQPLQTAEPAPVRDPLGLPPTRPAIAPQPGDKAAVVEPPAMVVPNAAPQPYKVPEPKRADDIPVRSSDPTNIWDRPSVTAPALTNWFTGTTARPTLGQQKNPPASIWGKPAGK